MKAVKFAMTINDGKPIVINLARLSELSGYDLSHIRKILKRTRNPSIKCLQALARVLDMDMDSTFKAIENGTLVAKQGTQTSYRKRRDGRWYKQATGNVKEDSND